MLPKDYINFPIIFFFVHIYHEANPLDEIWFVPNAGHTKTFGIDPEGYVERIASFFSKFEKTPLQNKQPSAAI